MEKNSSGKKLIICIIAVIAIIAIIVGIVAIVKKNKDEDKKETTPSIAGYYRVVEIYASNSEEAIKPETLEKLGLIITLDLQEDKTGVINMFGEESKITYDNETITVEGADTSFPYTVEGERLTLTNGEERMIFEKTEKGAKTETEEIEETVETPETDE